MLRLFMVVAALSVSLVNPAEAQLLQRYVITLDAAKRAADAAEAEAVNNGWDVAIAIVDHAGDLVLFRRIDGVRPLSLDIALAKARTAARLQVPTKNLQDGMMEGRVNLGTVPGLTALEGGVPIVVDDQVVGAVGVSGVASEDDARIASAGAAAVTP